MPDFDLRNLDRDAQLLDLDRVGCEDSLYLFLQGAWPVIDSEPWSEGWPIEAVCEHLQAVIDGDIRFLIINIPPRMGKNCANDTPVLTTEGWKTHGDLVVGDEVFTPSGKPARVLAVSQEYPTDVRVEFFDGSVFYCHENHEWTMFNREYRDWQTLETRSWLEPRKGRWGTTSGKQKQVMSGDRALYQLPLVEPLQFPWVNLACDPSRFAERRRLSLKSVEWDPCGKVGHCIEIDSEDGLYLIGKNLIPTHNSSVCSVALPAWTWAQRQLETVSGKPYHSPTSGPGTKFLHASYNISLSLRDSVKCRRLIESQWYQKRWGTRYQLESDQNTKTRFTNDAGGERLITSIGARITGEGGNIIVIDDPNAANEAYSEATIQETKDWWDQTMPTRLNSQSKGAYIIIQQRLSEDDLSGHILEKNSGEWCHLFLPMRYEADRSCVTMVNNEIFWEDPRKIEGTLLWPERFEDKAVKRLETQMGPFIAAGQLQQRPEPLGGGIIKREWWNLWDKPKMPSMDYVLACLDTAYTIKTVNDPSAMIVWGVYTDSSAQASSVIDGDGRIVYNSRTIHESCPHAMLQNAWTARLELHQLVERVAATCREYEVDLLLIENKAAGISVAQEIRRLYSNEKFGVQLFDPKSQDKLARLYSVQHLFAEGLIYAPDKTWADAVFKEVGVFPHGRHDDLVDCVSMGLRTLREMGLLARQTERVAEYESLKQYRPKLLPLYPA